MHTLQYDPVCPHQAVRSDSPVFKSGEGCDCFNHWGAVQGIVCDFSDKGIRGHASSAMLFRNQDNMEMLWSAALV